MAIFCHLSELLFPSEPWRRCPREASTPSCRPSCPRSRDEILEVIAAEVPDYARPLEGAFGAGIRLGVEEALRQFADLIADPEQPARDEPRGLRPARARARCARAAASTRCRRHTGSARASPGGGSRRRACGRGARARCPGDLADAIFAYIDELAAELGGGLRASTAGRARASASGDGGSCSPRSSRRNSTRTQSPAPRAKPHGNGRRPSPSSPARRMTSTSSRDG